MVFNGRRVVAPPSLTSTNLLVVPALSTIAAPTPALPPPDPNFVRVTSLKLPAAAAPEADRVLRELQSAYRCLHTGNQRALAAWLSPEDAPTTLEEMSTSMQRSLSKLPDACYVTTALPQVINPRTPGPLMEVLFRDLDGRPDAIRLRTLFLIAGTESHPRAGEALEDLQTLLHTDYQRDWSRWNSAISAQLVRENHGSRGVSCRMH